MLTVALVAFAAVLAIAPASFSMPLITENSVGQHGMRATNALDPIIANAVRNESRTKVATVARRSSSSSSFEWRYVGLGAGAFALLGLGTGTLLTIRRRGTLAHS
jgi:hypothetical protein